jgi:hypothetical protein
MSYFFASNYVFTVPYSESGLRPKSQLGGSNMSPKFETFILAACLSLGGITPCAAASTDTASVSRVASSLGEARAITKAELGRSVTRLMADGTSPVPPVPKRQLTADGTSPVPPVPQITANDAGEVYSADGTSPVPPVPQITANDAGGVYSADGTSPVPPVPQITANDAGEVYSADGTSPVPPVPQREQAADGTSPVPPVPQTTRVAA